MQSTSETRPAKSKNDEKLYTASQWQLMWWRFTKHKLAVISAVVVILLYITALFCEFIAPYDPNKYYADYNLNPPQTMRFVDSLGIVTENYPLNPNGSPGGITGLTTKDGRFNVLMPHPERTHRIENFSWHPEGWTRSPWLRMFENARVWLG